VPDVYQGTELWDLSLVDPDNRRPVDYDERRRLLATGDHAKQLLIRTALRVRRERPDAFGPDAGYQPLTAAGERADRLLAYGRGDDVVVAVPRLVLGLAAGWGSTTFTLPEGTWVSAFDDAARGQGDVEVAELLRAFPVALLVRA
jgi:(1->4)-alpha-D-glucan 1-alpha-D-glucosylmutase